MCEMNRRVVLYAGVSLDGYIADETGGVAWMSGEDEAYEGDYGYADFYANVDTVIMGMTTYQQIATELFPEGWPYAGKACYVFTHRQVEDTENVSFVSGELKELIDQLKGQPGKWIWICGGAKLANQLIKEDLIDVYDLTVLPTILGSGTLLFARDNPKWNLHLEKMEQSNGAINMVYSRRR